MEPKTKLTEEQKQKYLDSGGQLCPYCDSDYIEAGDTEYGGSTQTTKVSCNDCGRDWFDIYALVGIEDE